eukprot:4292757-Pyramimonas_sp.AAC.1
MLGQRRIEFREGVLKLVEHPWPDWVIWAENVPLGPPFHLRERGGAARSASGLQGDVPPRGLGRRRRGARG